MVSQFFVFWIHHWKPLTMLNCCHFDKGMAPPKHHIVLAWILVETLFENTSLFWDNKMHPKAKGISRTQFLPEEHIGKNKHVCTVNVGPHFLCAVHWRLWVLWKQFSCLNHFCVSSKPSSTKFALIRNQLFLISIPHVKSRFGQSPCALVKCLCGFLATHAFHSSNLPVHFSCDCLCFVHCFNDGPVNSFHMDKFHMTQWKCHSDSLMVSLKNLVIHHKNFGNQFWCNLAREVNPELALLESEWSTSVLLEPELAIIAKLSQNKPERTQRGTGNMIFEEEWAKLD